MARISKTDRENAIARLRAMLKPGDRITCTVRHVSASGMSRSIMLQVPVREADGNLRIADISRLAVEAGAADGWDEKRWAAKMSGCGMNMCFAVVYNLGRILFPDGFAPSEFATRPSDGKRVNVNVGRGVKRAAAIPFALDREWIAKKRAAGFVFERGRNGDASGWDNDGGYALDYRG